MRKPKRPKQPKKSSSLQVWQRWDARMADWKKRVKAVDEAPRKKEAIRNKHR